MRILFIDSVGSWGGGAQMSLLALATELNRRAWKTTLVSPSTGELAQHFREAGTDVVYAPSSHFRRWSPFGYYISGPLLLRDRLKSFRPDVVHTNCEESIRTAVRAGNSLGVPVLAHIRDFDRGWFRPHVLPALNQAGVVVPISDALSRFCVTSGVDPSLIDRIYNGIDAGPFQNARATRESVRHELGLTADDIAVAVVGHLAPSKGQQDVMAAAALMSGVPLKLLFIGEDRHPSGVNFRYLRSLTMESGGEQSVRFLGFRSDVPKLMGAVDILVAPFRNEAFGRVVVEGMLAGIPVVAYRSEGLAELIDDGQDGLLVDTGDLGRLADAMNRFATDPTLRSRLVAGGRRKAARFSLDAHVDAVAALYQRLVRETSQRGVRK